MFLTKRSKAEQTPPESLIDRFSGFVHAIGGMDGPMSLLFSSRPELGAPIATAVFVFVLTNCAGLGSCLEYSSDTHRERISRGLITYLTRSALPAKEPPTLQVATRVWLHYLWRSTCRAAANLRARAGFRATKFPTLTTRPRRASCRTFVMSH
jgi:hypothetical protein